VHFVAHVSTKKFENWQSNTLFVRDVKPAEFLWAP
jgi:hypothetical protein